MIVLRSFRQHLLARDRMDVHVGCVWCLLVGNFIVTWVGLWPDMVLALLQLVWCYRVDTISLGVASDRG